MAPQGGRTETIYCAILDLTRLTPNIDRNIQGEGVTEVFSAKNRIA